MHPLKDRTRMTMWNLQVCYKHRSRTLEMVSTRIEPNHPTRVYKFWIIQQGCRMKIVLKEDRTPVLWRHRPEVAMDLHIWG